MRDYYPLLNSTHTKPSKSTKENWAKKSPTFNSTAGTNRAFTVYLRCDTIKLEILLTNKLKKAILKLEKMASGCKISIDLF